MKKIVSFITISLLAGSLHAQGPQGNDFGFGIILGDPTGGTVKFWLNPENAIEGDVGYSYFGSPRIDIDYVWHFQAFKSQVVKLYAAFGGSVGFGSGYYYSVIYNRKGEVIYYTRDDAPFYYRSPYGKDIGFGIRALFGLNIIPKRTPLELFLHFGPLIGISPGGLAIDIAAGVRFYP